MIDPLISLAVAAYKNPGVYALLVGSGVSRSAKIPTGWEVVLDLIRKVALLEQANCEPDPVSWWQARTGEEPDYSKLLDQLAKTPIERQQLLRSYFEPTDDERSEGVKCPTRAHRAIAKLVQHQVVRVILTTNFDRLIERALEEVGVTPTVLSTADQIAGSLPLVHSGVTVLKVNGDYLDSRIRNTQAELAEYDLGLAALLHQIFDEYGLIVCGWSADWDVALSEGITSSPSRRFTTYWTQRGEPSPKAQTLIQFRRAEAIPISGADDFFTRLEESVRALRDSDATHPLTPTIVAAIAKRHLVDPMGFIRLHDLAFAEVERAYAAVNGSGLSFDSEARLVVEAAPVLAATLKRYEAAIESVLQLLITGCFWGNDSHRELWVDALERLANHNPIARGVDWLLNLRLYPALLLQYGATIAAIAAKKFATVKALLERPMRRDSGVESPLSLVLDPYRIFNADITAAMLGVTGRVFTPVNDYLHTRLRLPLREYLVQDARYDAAFDLYEYLHSLVWMDHALQTEAATWAPIGRYSWKNRNLLRQRTLNVLEGEVEHAGANWPPVIAGMFGGSSARAIAAKVALRELINQTRML